MTVPDIRNYPGYYGAFTREQANGAMPNGTRVEKRNSEPEDGHQNGDQGVILGSYEFPDDVQLPAGYKELGIKYCYFIEWDDMPRYAIGSVDYKVSLMGEKA